MKKLKRWSKRLIFIPLFALLLLLAPVWIITAIFTTPSNNRDWNADQTVLPFAEINRNMVTVHNIRNFRYASTTSYTPAFYYKTFDMSKIKKAWYIVEPFSGIPGSAHTFLSFEFEDNQFVSISVEIRKEKGESFNPIKGLFNQFEVMYVIADEKDVIDLRANYRKDMVFLYPVRASKEKVAALFLDMLSKANELKDKPEFYNTLTNTCTTNIVHHINKLMDDKIWALRTDILFPANSDRLALELGLLDTDLPLLEARAKYHINEKAAKAINSETFSTDIREGLND